jgi:hypothetical protein
MNHYSISKRCGIRTRESLALLADPTDVDDMAFNLNLLLIDLPLQESLRQNLSIKHPDLTGSVLPI